MIKPSKATLPAETVKHEGERGGERMPKMKKIINRLITWLREHGLSDEAIADCVEYITR